MVGRIFEGITGTSICPLSVVRTSPNIRGIQTRRPYTKRLDGYKHMQNCINLRQKIIETVYRAKEGHIASALSILDLIYVAYDKVLNTPLDKFILSKGHGCLALYVVLADKKFFGEEELLHYCQFGANLGGHPYPYLPGVEAATGSLGHGFPFGVGIALGMKLKQSQGRVVVLVGDQECNEGTIWESALLANQHNLDNLTLIIDSNKSSARSLSMVGLADKFSSFGWDTTMIDGHNHSHIENALKMTHYKPMVIIANTIKGHGCKIIENDPNEWHHKIPTDTEYTQLLS